jgi:hypothetical protein
MAEATTSSSGSSTVSVNASIKSKQYIRVSSKDDELEPDALRGSEQVMKDAGVVDDEEERRKAYKEEKK